MGFRITFYGGEVGGEMTIPTTSVEGEEWNATIDEVIEKLQSRKDPSAVSKDAD